MTVTIVSKLGDIRRFNESKQLITFLGLIPGEHSSEQTARPRRITTTGNKFIRSLLFEAAWSYQ